MGLHTAASHSSTAVRGSYTGIDVGGVAVRPRESAKKGPNATKPLGALIYSFNCATAAHATTHGATADMGNVAQRQAV